MDLFLYLLCKVELIALPLSSSDGSFRLDRGTTSHCLRTTRAVNVSGTRTPYATCLSARTRSTLHPKGIGAELALSLFGPNGPTLNLIGDLMWTLKSLSELWSAHLAGILSLPVPNFELRSTQGLETRFVMAEFSSSNPLLQACFMES